MPLYDYKCPHCGGKKEVILVKYDRPKIVCSCGREMESVISPSAFHLKGGGWTPKSGRGRSE